ncbi:hypothetical protein DFJ74DRAFT_289850 [Hyaloraphidium curvatum]|nr:hypothetical protein DFJ74DRAFT_289850 [Hyaloraphidium curvatum]
MRDGESRDRWTRPEAVERNRTSRRRACARSAAMSACSGGCHHEHPRQGSAGTPPRAVPSRSRGDVAVQIPVHEIVTPDQAGLMKWRENEQAWRESPDCAYAGCPRLEPKKKDAVACRWRAGGDACGTLRARLAGWSACRSAQSPAALASCRRTPPPRVATAAGTPRVRIVRCRAQGPGLRNPGRTGSRTKNGARPTSRVAGSSFFNVYGVA